MIEKRTAVFALIAGLAACGDNLADPRVARSGARLKLVRYAYDGEPVEIDRTRYFDRELHTFCAVQTWSDGARYCTPPIAEAVFTNDNCTKALGVGLGVEPPSYFAVLYELGGESRVSELYRNLAPAEPPDKFWRRSDGTCAGPFYPDDSDGHRYYTIDGPLPVDDVRVKLTEPSDDPRLAEVFATTDDGLRLAVGVHDNELGVDCRADGQARAPMATCVPPIDATVAYFTDAGCAEPVIVSPRLPTAATFVRPGTGCVEYYEPTDELAPASLYQIVGDACAVYLHPQTEHVFGMRPIAPATVSREARGAGRVQAIALGELAIADTLLHDTLLATDCERIMLPDGEERCLPTSSATFATVFSDADCATTVSIALVPSRECDVAAAYVRGPDVHEIGELYAGELFEPTTGDRCQLYHAPAGLVPHAVGPAIPLDQFPLATTQIDP